MYYIIDNSTDPQWNLAAEEYLFKNFKQSIFRLWRNEPSIIIGLHQNAFAEINLEYVKNNNISVIRRLTGGGAVFHDLGNVNFTFIDNRILGESTADMFKRFTQPIIEALNSLGVNASLKGRNDLVIDDKKFSGNAVAVYKERILQHGTLLYSASMANLSEALANRPEHFKGKAVQSNRARVTNISDHLSNAMSVEEFVTFMEKFVTDKLSSKYTRYNYTPEDLAAIAKLTMEKYSKDSWNYGSSPKYDYSKTTRFEWGILELFLEVKKGIIEDIHFYGSYFFIKESTILEEYLKGCPNNAQAIKERVEKINLSDYFSNITEEEFVSMFLQQQSY